MKIRNQLVVTVATIVAVSAWALFSQPASAQVIFNDTFTSGNSTVDAVSPAAPTAVSTDYEVASSKNTTNSVGAQLCNITTGDLHLTLTTATTSGAEEIQALFTSSPVNLVQLNQYVELAITFTNTSGVCPGGASTLNIGLYNSGGVAPLSGGVLAISGLNGNSPSPYTNNGAQLWNGVVGLMNVGGNSQVNARPPQTGLGQTSANQDLLFNGAFTGAYNNPKGGTQHSQTTSGLGLADGQQYTDVMVVQLVSSGLLISNQFYSGTATSGPALFAIGNISNGVTSASFDSLAFGYYIKSTNSLPVCDISEVIVTIPEPSTFMLLAAGLATMAGLVSRRRRS
jgi:hypothetical protein